MIAVIVLLLIFSNAFLCAFQDSNIAWGDVPITIMGTAYRIDTIGQKFELRDGWNSRYTVQASGAEFSYEGRRVGFRDLREGMQVKVRGRQAGARTVSAQNVWILSRLDVDFGHYGSMGSIRTVSGEVESKSDYLGRLYLRTDLRRIEVIVTRETEIRESGRPRWFSDIRRGAYLSVTGRMSDYKTLFARTIEIIASEPRGPGLDYSIAGTLLRDTIIFDRTLRVRTTNGERRMEVPRNAEVRLDGYPASIYELLPGDRIQATGRWSGSLFVARKVEARQGTIERTYGRIIDIRGQEIKLDADRYKLQVDGSRADIYLDGLRTSTRNLRRGDYATIYGSRRANRIYASRIDARRYRR